MDNDLTARMKTMETQLRMLLDKQAIHDKLMLYCRGVDRNDAELISQAYHPDAIANHGYVVFTGENFAREYTRLGVPPSASHMISNLMIEIDGDEAVSESYFLDTHERDRDGEPFMFLKCARFIDVWERRDDEWGIIYREVADSWSRVWPGSERFPGSDLVTGSRTDRDDIVYTIREAAKHRHEQPLEGRDITSFLARFSGSGFETVDD